MRIASFNLVPMQNYYISKLLATKPDLENAQQNSTMFQRNPHNYIHI